MQTNVTYLHFTDYYREQLNAEHNCGCTMTNGTNKISRDKRKNATQQTRDFRNTNNNKIDDVFSQDAGGN